MKDKKMYPSLIGFLALMSEHKSVCLADLPSLNGARATRLAGKGRSKSTTNSSEKYMYCSRGMKQNLYA
jgi:hypothetical protein